MSVQLKDRKQVKLGNFRGLDFSSSPLLVSPSRAVNAKNFIFENGVNHKRNGWIQRLKIGSGKVNGIFECKLNGNKLLIAYVGTAFYKITKDATTGAYSYTDITTTDNVDTTKLTDNRISMFVCNNKAYFVGCGDYLVLGYYNSSLKLKRVYNDEDTYIPLTTVEISKDTSDGTADNRKDGEDVNLLSSWQMNSIVGDEANSTFTVSSGEIDTSTIVTVWHELLDNGVLVNKVYKNKTADYTNLYEYDAEHDTYGSTSVGSINFTKGKITFSIDTTPYEENKANIKVLFSSEISGYDTLVRKMKFGITFGANGGSDRLFLSGNSDYSNMDIWSASDDFTYFSSLDANTIGSTNSAIMGYSRLGDGTLAIHKEEISGEPSIFYRSAYDKTTYDESTGKILKIMTYFPVQAGTSGEGAINCYCNANLAGDTLFVSRNGVYGITLGNNVAVSERYAKERSTPINTDLVAHDLSNAIGLVYRNKYYLCVDNVCYIADARFTSSNNNNLPDTYSYEWWYWDNIPARVLANVNGDLFFGTSDGRICEFTNKYCDTSFDTIQAGDVSIDYSDSTITYAPTLDLASGDEIVFKTNLYRQIISPDNITQIGEDAYGNTNKIYVDEETIQKIYSGMEVYADIPSGSDVNISSTGLSVNTKYTIVNVDWGECCFSLAGSPSFYLTLTDVNNRVLFSNVGTEYLVNIQASGFRLSEFIKNTTLFVNELSEETLNGSTYHYLTLKYTANGSDNIVLVNYNDSVASISPYGDIVRNRNVVAEWQTPILDLGTNEASKTLLKLTISTEPVTNGKIKFGYETRKSSEEFNAKGVRVFSFEDMDFNNFTFNTTFASSYSRDVKEEFNFIQFSFQSDNASDCVIHSITLTYKINQSNKGVQ